MAGHAAKKAAQRSRWATSIFLTIAIFANLIYFIVQFLVRRQSLSRGEWTGVLFLEGLYAISIFTLIQGAEANQRPQSALDMFVLTAVVQLGSLVFAWAWKLLWLIAVYVVYAFGPMFLTFVQSQRAEMAADAAAYAATSKEDEVMKAKRLRRQEHKNARYEKVQ